jgi:hypothetical protein
MTNGAIRSHIASLRTSRSNTQDRPPPPPTAVLKRVRPAKTPKSPQNLER